MDGAGPAKAMAGSRIGRDRGRGGGPIRVVGRAPRDRWWAGPRSIGVGTEGADALAVSPDGKILYAANWDEDGDSGGITLVNLATGRSGKRIGTGAPAVKLALMPGGQTLYALVEPRR